MFALKGVAIVFIKPFQDTSIILYTLKAIENHIFSDILGGIERDQWHEMG